MIRDCTTCQHNDGDGWCTELRQTCHPLPADGYCLSWKYDSEQRLDAMDKQLQELREYCKLLEFCLTKVGVVIQRV